MAPKRKLPALGLQRRVRPRREEEWVSEPEDSEASSDNDDVSEEGISRPDEDGSEDGSEDEKGSDSESDSEASEPSPPKVDLSSVSFGALAKAQASLPPTTRKSGSEKSKPPAEAVTEAPSRKPKSDEPKPKPKRSSKHAPQEQSSKRPVSRRREILPDLRRKARDPRFDPLVGGKIDEAKAKKAYAFLDEYRETEMADLRAQIKKTKNEVQKEDLKRQLMSMESKKKARLRREEQETLIEEHRKKEKELVAQGKTPFYLKKSEQKKKLLMDRYAGMSKGQVDRAIQRKRKKVAGKEKKEMDSLQRVRPRD